jgi:hypothetical protein
MYSDTDIVVKQKFVREALANNDLDGALNLCQVDGASRRACGQLDPVVKADLCLRNDTLARRCDEIPIYSRDQFLALIPPFIEIEVDDPLQLRYEFYSQNYKLPTEGFAEALLKAKTLNTVVALLRPFDLLKYGDRFPPLPPYISAFTLDEALKTFKELDVARPGEDYYIVIEATGTLRLPQMSDTVMDLDFKMHIFWDVNAQRVTSVWAGVYAQALVSSQNLANDPALGKFLKDLLSDKFIPSRDFSQTVWDRSRWVTTGWINILSNNWPNDVSNSFVISRFLHNLLSAGLALESVSYGQSNGFRIGYSAVVYYKPKKVEVDPSLIQPRQLSPGAQALAARFGN